MSISNPPASKQRGAAAGMLDSIDDHSATGPFLGGYLPYLLHRADVLMSQPFHADLLAEGVQMSEWRVLAVLDGRGERTIMELATETMLAQPTVTHAVARLEERGDVERRRSATDRRQRIVTLTETGTAKVAALVEQARRHERAALADIADVGPELGDLLRRLIVALETPNA